MFCPLRWFYQIECLALDPSLKSESVSVAGLLGWPEENNDFCWRFKHQKDATLQCIDLVPNIFLWASWHDNSFLLSSCWGVEYGCQVNETTWSVSLIHKNLYKDPITGLISHMFTQIHTKFPNMFFFFTTPKRTPTKLSWNRKQPSPLPPPKRKNGPAIPMTDPWDECIFTYIDPIKINHSCTWYPKQPVLNGWKWWFPSISYVKIWWKSSNWARQPLK